MRNQKSNYQFSGWHFALFRISLGIYLMIHFGSLIPYASELWSGKGALSDPTLLPTYGLFPNPLFFFKSPLFATVFIWILGALSVALTLGFFRRLASLLLWFGWACLLGRNPFIANPGIPFIGFLLLICSVVPQGEPLSLGRRKDPGSWRMPSGIYQGVWILMGLGYTLSGLHKCLSPSWVDGTAIFHLLNNPLARDHGLRQFFLNLPDLILRINTWGVLLLEIAFGPLSLFPPLRKWVWLAMVAMHLGILSLVSFADLTFGVLMVHLFTFDERWLPSRKVTKQNPVLFFDGVCGLCNSFVQFLFDIDTGEIFKVSPLQDALARETIGKQLSGDLKTLVVLTDRNEILTKSRAVLFIFDQVGGVWRVLSWIGFPFPYRFLDHLYDFVAGNRYRWFGKLETCRMPTPSERSRFLSGPT